MKNFYQYFLKLRNYKLINVVFLVAFLGVATNEIRAQTADLSGAVKDSTGAAIANARVMIRNRSVNLLRETTTNGDGFFNLFQLSPGSYEIEISSAGFAATKISDVTLNIGDRRTLNIELSLAAVGATVEVVNESSLLDESPAVATTVDRRFVENLPLNGRSFQSLIQLTPGVVLTKSSQDAGQFSVNGQRANANYFTVDGVSANVGINANPAVGQAGAGSLPGLTALGTTSNLVSIDALQEFKIQTSTYAPEFGRTPGGEVQLLTRSGTNRFSGGVFEYFRNDRLDANDFFANRAGLKRPPLRQNLFGGTFSGPLFLPLFGEGMPFFYDGRDRTFFFVSYEGLRLRQPQTALSTVPSLASRRQARIQAPQVAPFFDAYPLPNGRDLANNLSEFNASYSNPSNFDATSLRADHKANQNLTIFGRFNHSPSETIVRSPRQLATVTTTEIETTTLTLGADAVISSRAANEFRANYSLSRGASLSSLDNFGGAVPPALSQIFPAFIDTANAQSDISIGNGRSFIVGNNGDNRQRQLNFVNNFSYLAGNHALKLGTDYRRLKLVTGPDQYRQAFTFNNVAAALTSTVGFFLNDAKDAITLNFNNYSFYAQDTWRMTNRLTLTYGLRYELNPPPKGRGNHQPFALVDSFNDPQTARLAPQGATLYNTTRTNFAPRFGAAFQLNNKPGRETILRGGAGVFYDLGTGIIASATSASPFLRTRRSTGATVFPIPAILAAPVTIEGLMPPYDVLRVFDPVIESPRTYQFNASVEQSFGASQTLTMSYVGAFGRRLLRGEIYSSTAATSLFRSLQVTRSRAESDYHALQMQFQRRLSKGFQLLASYTFAKSLDNASNDASLLLRSDAFNPGLDRSFSDFDVRQSFNVGATYEIPVPFENKTARRIFGGFALDGIFYTRSATPFDITYSRNTSFGFINLRPDLVLGVPRYLDDPNAPRGLIVNNGKANLPANQVGAFVAPVEARQGTLSRNALRGFSLFQLDLAVRRTFSLTEQIRLQLCAEAFNTFNHANFADPSGALNYVAPTASSPLGSLTAPTTFGVSANQLRASLGGLNSVYQVGGPRSLQLAVRLNF